MGVEAIHIPPHRRANKALVADFFGVAMASVDGWIRRGCPVHTTRRARYAFGLRSSSLGGWRFGGKRIEADISPEDMTPKERRDWYEGEKVRIALEIDKGNLITLDQYREEMARILKQLANALETLPDTLERKCALSGAVVDAIQTEMDKERTALVLQLEGATDERAA